MDSCNTCGKDIVFGGITESGFRFCSKKCHGKGFKLIEARKNIPKELVIEKAIQIYNGLCPKCRGRGPVDVHISYDIFSFILTFKRSKINLCCSSCGKKSQMASLFLALVLGWWGLEGIYMTPVTIIKNIVGMTKNSDVEGPSENLREIITNEIVARRIDES